MTTENELLAMVASGAAALGQNITYREPIKGVGADVSLAISAQNTFTPWVALLGEFNLSISGTWAGTVTIQRTFDGGTTVLDVNTYTANIEDRGSEPHGHGYTLYRVGIKTGQYTSGTANVRLNQ